MFDTVKELFPHSRRDVHCHRFYLANTLKLIAYAPTLRTRTIHLIVERFVDLDVQIALQQRNLEEAVADDPDAIFEVDLCDATAEEVVRMRQNADKLDEVGVWAFSSHSQITLSWFEREVAVQLLHVICH